MQNGTKQDLQALMLRLLAPLKPHYSESGARLTLGNTGATYDTAAIELEGFSRPLWALAPYWLGGGKNAEDFAETYRRGLASGTNPDHPDYWGSPTDCDQRFVEMAAIACAILETPERVWQPLTAAEQQNLAAWLNTINQHELPACNWLFFMVLVNLALRSVGMPCDMARADKALDEIDGWYLGDGWYSDGAANVKPQKDYYIPWAIAYYGALYSKFAAAHDPLRSAAFRQRSVALGQQLAYWFDQNGAALPFGRSLSYRFGQCAFYAACLFADIEPLPVPVMKGIILRNLDWWLEQPIFDRDGVLTIGYCYPQMYMAERYNAPGSPYWGLKSFLVLALPDDHPFWTAEAAPLPTGQMQALKPLPCADMLVQRLPDGQVNAYVPGIVEQNDHGQFAEKYAKFVYSTRFGFSASRSQMTLSQAAPDSMLAFVFGGQVFVRRHSQDFTLFADRIISRWQPLPGVSVITEIVPCEGGHLRRHTIQNDSGTPCEAYDCGFALPKFAAGFAKTQEPHLASAQNETAFCSIAGSGKGVVIEADPNTNLYSPNTVIPALYSAIPIGETTLETTVLARSVQPE